MQPFRVAYIAKDRYQYVSATSSENLRRCELIGTTDRNNPPYFWFAWKEGPRQMELPKQIRRVTCMRGHVRLIELLTHVNTWHFNGRLATFRRH